MITDPDPERWAEAELHYVHFGNAEVFYSLLRRYRLRFMGTARCCPAHVHEWGAAFGRSLISLRTADDPRRRTECGRGTAPGPEGYASYVAVSGDMPLVEALYRDVIESAQGIKGEFVPLTLVESGEVVAENWRGRDGL